jgi:hypothetical protein
MSDTVIAATIASLFGIITAIFSAFLSSKFYKDQTKSELEKEFASRFNERKWKTYTDFTNVLIEVFKTIGTDKKINQAKLMERLRSVAGELWIIAPTDVINAYTA